MSQGDFLSNIDSIISTEYFGFHYISILVLKGAPVKAFKFNVLTKYSVTY